MGVEYVCDGCDKREPARFNVKGEPIKPSRWVETNDPEFGPTHICGTNCEGKYSDKDN